jgi:hypothetical protein
MPSLALATWRRIALATRRPILLATRRRIALATRARSIILAARRRCSAAVAIAILACALPAQAVPPLPQDNPNSFITVWSPLRPGNAYGFFTETTRTGGSLAPLHDFTVAAQLVAKNGPGVHQWAFGVASEAWAQPGSQSILVGLESAVINEEPSNVFPKIANNAVMKNRADGAPDPGAPLNANSIAYWVTAQPGTGFERGLAFDRVSLRAASGHPAAIDLSDIPDDQIGQIDLIRIRRNVALRYDPVTRQLYLHTD